MIIPLIWKFTSQGEPWDTGGHGGTLGTLAGTMDIGGAVGHWGTLRDHGGHWAHWGTLTTLGDTD